MPIYDWRHYRTRPWAQRFPKWARGAKEWRAFDVVESAPSKLYEERLRIGIRPSPPCVFVSHRQADTQQALRIAYMACREGFDYWLDVLDPNLSSLPAAGSMGATMSQTAFAVAAIIEMALLNSTHVVAVMTENTKGSMWVPYEYGRVKAPTPITLEAACWIDAGLRSSPIPEYLWLGVVTASETDLRTWLMHQAQTYGATPGSCRWMESIPSPL
jgi:hypothetical protein